MSTTRKSLASLIAIAAIALAGCSGGASNESGESAESGAAAPSGSADASGFQAPGPDDKGGENNPVKIGVVGKSQSQWSVFQEKATEAGISVDIVDFTDYQQPNPAVADGSLDVNQFQHILFLAQYNNESGADLQPFGSTAIYPLALYSNEFDSVEAIPEGSKIAVPNDGTNQARALGVLAQVGLITLKEGTPSLSATPNDIDTDTSTVEVTPVAADQTGRSLSDPQIAGAVINNDYVADTGLEPQDAIAEDDPEDPASAPYINIWATTADQINNPVYLKLVEISQSDAVEAELLKNSGDSGVIVHASIEELQSILADSEEQLKAQS